MAGDIGGFFRMTGKSDGTGSIFDNTFNLKSRFANREASYARFNGVDPDTGEVLDYVPPKNVKNPYKKMAGRSTQISLPKISSQNVSTLLNIGLIAGIGLVGYKLYNHFFNGAQSIINDATDKGAKAIANTYVDGNQATANAVTAASSDLSKVGLNVNTMHQNIANQLYAWINTSWVENDKIVNTILGENIQTFKLVAQAYGSRQLPDYAAWHLTAFIENAFSKTKYLGTLKKHLQLVLSDSELKKIAKYISVIP